MGTGSLGSMWLGHWQATDVACKVLDRLEDYVETADIHTLMETEVGHSCQAESRGCWLPCHFWDECASPLIALPSNATLHRCSRCGLCLHGL